MIIAAYNGRQYWPELMPLLIREQYVDFELEVLVVDNNSSDDSVSYLRGNFPQLKIIVNFENLGFVGANNIGYEYARRQQADYIFLLNQDTVIKPGWLQPLYDFANTHQFGSLQPQILLWPDTSRINTLGNVIHFLGFGYGSHSGEQIKKNLAVKKINYASGAGAFISLKALADLNKVLANSEFNAVLFDPTMFMYLEDLDLGWSLSLLGYDHYLIPQSILYHKYKFNRSMKHYYWFERNRLWVMLKNYKWPTLVLIFPAWIIMELGQLLFALMNKRFWQKIRSYGFLFSPSSWRTLLAYRHALQKHRVRGDRQVAGYFNGRILFQELSSVLLDLANICFYIYWTIIKQLLFW